MQYNTSFIQANPSLETLVSQCMEIDPTQFWIDCTTMPPVIAATQADGEMVLIKLLKMTRNYCHVMHKARLNMLSVT